MSACAAEPSEIILESSMGETSVIDGDLSNVDARNAFTSGLCGDLAIAIHEINQAPIFFVCDAETTQEEFDSDCADSLEYVFDYAIHAVVGSRKPGHYVDSYGQRTEEDYVSFYAQLGMNVRLLAGTPEQANYYSLNRDPHLYRNFAAAAICLDENNEAYTQEVTYA